LLRNVRGPIAFDRSFVLVGVALETLWTLWTHDCSSSGADRLRPELAGALARRSGRRRPANAESLSYGLL
jgi:hypothetical protein